MFLVNYMKNLQKHNYKIPLLLAKSGEKIMIIIDL